MRVGPLLERRRQSRGVRRGDLLRRAAAIAASYAGAAAGDRDPRPFAAALAADATAGAASLAATALSSTTVAAAALAAAALAAASAADRAAISSAVASAAFAAAGTAVAAALRTAGGGVLI